MRAVRLLERQDLLVGELQLHGLNRVVELGEPSGADDGRRDAGSGKEPGERHLCHGHTAPIGDALHRVDDLPVDLPLVHLVAEGIAESGVAHGAEGSVVRRR